MTPLETSGANACLLFFQMAAELEAHGGQNLGSEVGLAARRKARVERFGEHRSGRTGFDARENRPATFAGVRNFTAEFIELGRVQERDGGEVEQPGSDDAATTPDFGDFGEVEVVHVVLGIAEGSSFGVALASDMLAGVGVLENVKTFGVGGHQAVLDAVMNHLDEVSCAARPAMEIAVFGRAAGNFFAAGSAIHVAAAGSESLEDRIQVLDDVGLAANHLAVTAFEAPDAAGGADVGLANAFGFQLFGAANVVDVVGVAAINDDVALVKLGGQVRERRIHGEGRDHQPYGARLGELLDKFI